MNRKVDEVIDHVIMKIRSEDVALIKEGTVEDNLGVNIH
jgi:hypothetical protein